LRNAIGLVEDMTALIWGIGIENPVAIGSASSSRFDRYVSCF
jgi:hypothetical protein